MTDRFPDQKNLPVAAKNSLKKHQNASNHKRKSCIPQPHRKEPKVSPYSLPWEKWSSSWASATLLYFCLSSNFFLQVLLRVRFRISSSASVYNANYNYHTFRSTDILRNKQYFYNIDTTLATHTKKNTNPSLTCIWAVSIPPFSHEAIVIF